MKSRILSLATLLVLLALLPSLAPIAVSSSATSWRGSDFAFCFGVIQSYWDGSIKDPYQYEALRSVFLNRWGVTTDVVMPMAYTPTVLWILRPFSYFSDPALAWNLFSWLVLALALWVNRCRELRPIALGILLLLVSQASFVGLAVAQSAHLGVGLFILLLQPRHSRCTIFLQSIALLILSIKPTYFMLGISVLLLAGNFRPVIYSSMTVLILLLLAYLQLPDGAYANWWHALSFFSSPVDVRFLSSGTAQVFEHTLSLRSILAVVFDPQLGSMIARIAFWGWILVLAFSLCTAVTSVKVRTPPQIAFSQALVFAGFLSFSTYLGYYEQLLLIPMLLALSRTGVKNVRLETLGVLLLLPAAFIFPGPTALLATLILLGIAVLLRSATPKAV